MSAPERDASQSVIRTFLRRTRDFVVRLIVITTCAAAVGALAQPASEEAEEPREDVTLMSAFNVKADRLEDFGFRVRGTLRSPFGKAFPVVSAVWPNTAASKAGLKPGDRILKTDGKSAAVTLFSLLKWHKLQASKWAQVSAGKKNVTWELEIEPVGTTERRTVRMVVPTAPPHWGASTWQPPEGRATVKVDETGALAELSRTVLNNGLSSFETRGSFMLLGIDLPQNPRGADPFVNPVQGYEWHFTAAGVRHRFFVTQAVGDRTWILLESYSRDRSFHQFLTSPSGALERAMHRPRKGKFAEAPEEVARPAFAAELDFWLTKVGKVSPRWPLEIIPGSIPEVSAVAANAAKPAANAPLAAEFLKLPEATAEQQRLLRDAWGKVGGNSDRWAYTETSRGLEDKRVRVTRVDPSKPEAECVTLLKLDGKPPTAADLQLWRDEGGDTPSTFGSLPPLDRLLDANHVRILAEEAAAIVFELPLRNDNAQFPADKLRALLRVNKATRAFEDITVKLRDGFRVAGVAKVTEAGFEVRFRTFDPALAPQPVYFKIGGSARLLLVKLSRSFEVTRSDFQRVEPYEEPESAQKEN